jgi:hypothetical protein
MSNLNTHIDRIIRDGVQFVCSVVNLHCQQRKRELSYPIHLSGTLTETTNFTYGYLGFLGLDLKLLSSICLYKKKVKTP